MPAVRARFLGRLRFAAALAADIALFRLARALLSDYWRLLADSPLPVLLVTAAVLGPLILIQAALVLYDWDAGGLRPLV